MNHTRNLLLIAACLVGIFAGTAQAQTFYVGGGPALTQDGPAFNITTGVCSDDTTNCALVSYAARGSVKDYKSITYTTTVGARKVIAAVDTPAAKVELFALINAGAAVNGDGPSFTGAGGGGLTIHPKRAPNWGFSFAAQGAYDKDSQGHPNVFVQVGYTFKATK